MSLALKETIQEQDEDNALQFPLQCPHQQQAPLASLMTQMQVAASDSSADFPLLT